MSIWRRQGTAAAVCGVAFLALFGAGFAFLMVLASDFYPSPFEAGADIQRYVVENRSEVRVVGFFYTLAAVCLLGFAAFLAGLVGRTAGEMGALPALVLGGGAVAAAFLMLSALCLWILAREETAAEPALVRALHDLTYLAGGPAHVAALAPFLGATALATHRSGVLPGWIAWLGLAAAVASLPAVVALLWEPAAFLLPVARLLTYAWIFAVSLALAFGWPPAAGETGRGAVAEALRVDTDRIEAEMGPSAIPR